jgi:hypothetical protein
MVNDELENTRKKMVMAYFKVISQNHKNVSKRNQFPGVYLNPGPSEHKARVFTTES